MNKARRRLAKAKRRQMKLVERVLNDSMEFKRALNRELIFFRHDAIYIKKQYLAKLA